MKIILELDVDDTLGREFDRLTPEYKLQFKHVVHNLLQKTTSNFRSKRLRMLLDDIRNESNCPDSGCTPFDAEILLAMLRSEDY